MSQISDFVQNHKPLAIGVVVIGGLLIGGYLLSKKTTAAATQPNSNLTDTSGLTNHLVYVPTQTTFGTYNQSGLFAGNDPNLKSIATGTISTNSPLTINKPPSVIVPPVVVPPVVTPPVILPPRPRSEHDHRDGGSKKPNGIFFPRPGIMPPVVTHVPPTHSLPSPLPVAATNGKALQWTQSHTLQGAQTVSNIAPQINRSLKAQGMPGSMQVTPNQIYAQNSTALVPNNRTSPGDHLSAAHAGVRLTLPVWG